MKRFFPFSGDSVRGERDGAAQDALQAAAKKKKATFGELF